MDALKDMLLELLALLWLLLMPYLSALLFFALCLAAFLCRKHVRESGLAAMRMLLFLLGGYTLFNAYDFMRYQNTGLAISPINQTWFYLFSSPPDLYKPCAHILLSAASSEYQVTFKHAYGGAQSVELGLVNNAPQEFEYGRPDEVNLEFKGRLLSEDAGTAKDFNVAYASYYLSAETNYLPVCRYEIENVNELRRKYEMRVKIGGDIADFLKKYPGSFLVIRNGTTK